MKTIISIFFLFCFSKSFSQNVAINNDGSIPDESAILDVKSSNKGLLVPRMIQTNRLGITNPANGLLVFQTDGQSGYYYNAGSPASPIWTFINPINNDWSILGNNLSSTGLLGTTSNNHIDLVTNNSVRGRLTNLGEFFIGATNTTTIGDLMTAVSNATFPFAVNGYSSFNGAGVYGSILGGTTQFAGVQGEYQNSTGGIFNTAGVRGSNQSSIAGTGFRTTSATGPRIGVIGNTTAGSGQYTFGLHGSMGSTDIRCGGVLGDDFGIALASLGYYASNQVDYSVYGFGNAFQTGVTSGRNTSNHLSTTNTHIGLGIYGGVMGGWVRGLVYGTHLKGERYSLYVDGKTYTNEPIVELVKNEDGSRTPTYNVVTEVPNVYAKGKETLENGTKYIKFSDVFLKMANKEDIVITVSPLANSKGLYIAEQDDNGFKVMENNEGKANISFAWMAIASRKDVDKTNHSPELLGKDFDEKMGRVMYNDNNNDGKIQYLWWDGKNIRYDKPPAKKDDKNYKPMFRIE